MKINERGGELGLRKKIQSEELSFSYQNQILVEKKEGVSNINQSVHLVSSHMADQHANRANLLIFSKGVQLIPLAAFISRSHAEGRELQKKERDQRRVCYSSASTLFLSPFRSRGIKTR